MSTLEKAIGLLQDMPEHKVEAVYMYMCFVNSQIDNDKIILTPQEPLDSLMNQERSMEERQRGFQGLLSFAGTLPEDFN